MAHRELTVKAECLATVYRVRLHSCPETANSFARDKYTHDLPA